MQRLAMTFFLITALFATSGAFGDDKDVLADAVKRHICPGNAIKYRMLNVGDECKREFGQCDNLEMGTKVWYACMDEYSKRQRQCWNEVDKRNEIILAYNRLVDDCVNKKNAELLNQNKLTKPSTSGKGSSQSDDQYTYKERLSRAENNLQSAYQKLLKTVKDPKELSRIREDQSAFLARRNRCTTVVCMDDAYTTRIEEVLYETRVAKRMPHPADQDSDDPLAPPPPDSNNVAEPAPTTAEQAGPPACSNWRGYKACLERCPGNPDGLASCYNFCHQAIEEDVGSCVPDRPPG